MESILIAATAPLAYKLAGGKRRILNIITFLSIMMGITVLVMYYRCKISTKANNDGNKPDVDIKKAIIPMIPIIIWAILAFILPYLVKYNFPPPMLLVLLFVTGMLGLFIISLLFYTSAIRFSAVPQCYPSTLDQIFGFLKWLWPF